MCVHIDAGHADSRVSRIGIYGRFGGGVGDGEGAGVGGGPGCGGGPSDLRCSLICSPFVFSIVHLDS